MCSRNASPEAIERGANLGGGAFDPRVFSSVQSGLAESAVGELLGEKWPSSVAEEIETCAGVWTQPAE
jgi:hypothetical protein